MLVCLCSTLALGYPTKPIRVIVPSQAGGGADIVACVIGQKLTEAWGQQVVIDNRIGAVGPEMAAKALPDGHTLMFTTSALTVRESLYAKLAYNTLRDFQPVTQVLSQSNVLVVHPSVPAKTVPELIAYAKAKPGQLNYGSGGNGTSNHLAGVLFQMLAGIDVVHIPFKGVPAALTDTVAGPRALHDGQSRLDAPAREGRQAEVARSHHATARGHVARCADDRRITARL